MKTETIADNNTGSGVNPSAFFLTGMPQASTE